MLWGDLYLLKFYEMCLWRYKLEVPYFLLHLSKMFKVKGENVFLVY